MKKSPLDLVIMMEKSKNPAYSKTEKCPHCKQPMASHSENEHEMDMDSPEEEDVAEYGLDSSKDDYSKPRWDEEKAVQNLARSLAILIKK